MKSDAIVGSLKAAAAAGVDVDDALDQLSDLVTLAHSKPVKQNPDLVLSLVPVGPDTDATVAVGWDTCAGCKLGCSSCTCKNGPVEPAYVTKFRQDKPNFRVLTPVTKVSAKKVASPIIADPVPSDSDEAQSFPGPIGFLCATCKMRKPFDAVDKNDDGTTFTCHECQEASA